MSKNISIKKRTVTVDKIIDKSINLFMTNGYSNTTMSNIATACHIKKPSLYHHIRSRKELVILCATKYMNKFTENVLDKIFYGPDLKKNRNIFLENIRYFYIKENGFCFLLRMLIETNDKIPGLHKIIKDFHLFKLNRIIEIITNDEQEAVNLIGAIYADMILLKFSIP